MKTIILNGSKPGDEFSEKVLGILCAALQAQQREFIRFDLAGMKIAPCRGCFGCWVQKPGVCVLEDDAQKLAQEVIRSDLAVFFTPVTFGGYSADLKKGLDRLIGLISPFFMTISGETHHQKRYDRYPALLGVGLQKVPDRESGDIFSNLVERNAINFHSPGYAAQAISLGQDEKTIGDGLAAALNSLGGKL